MRHTSKDVKRCGETNDLAANVYGVLRCNRAAGTTHTHSDSSKSLQWAPGSFPVPMVGR